MKLPRPHVSAEERKDWIALLRDPLMVVAALAPWIFFMPWIVGSGDTGDAVALHVSMTILIPPLALLGLDLRIAAVLTIVCGVLLALGPFLLGYTGDGFFAWVADVVTGLAIAGLAFVSLRKRPAHGDLRGTAGPLEP